MFDDHQSKSLGQPPQNLPLGEPEDIFAGNDAASATPQPPVSDAQAVVKEDTPSILPETAISKGHLQPKLEPVPEIKVDQNPPIKEQNLSSPTSKIIETPSVFPPISSPPSSTPPPGPSTTAPPIQKNSNEIYSVKEPKLGKFLFRIVAVLFISLVVLGIIWVVYSALSRPSEEEQKNEETNNNVDDFFGTENNNQKEQESPTDNNRVKDIDDTILFGQPVDTDADGLDDNREKDLGTDPANWDTDGDQLSDGDEVIIWKTDPLNPDTDGDTFLDGEEIKSGYSPTGPGKIFEPPEENK